MAEVTARKKFSCPSCGGESQWNPAKKALVCPYCGTVSPGQTELDESGAEPARAMSLAMESAGLTPEQNEDDKKEAK